LSFPALFVSHQNSLEGPQGGQQTCTLEYWRVLEAAGFSLTKLCYETPRDFATRVLRKINRRPYLYQSPKDLPERIRADFQRLKPEFIFFNLNDTISLAMELKDLPAKKVLLSHGFASVDRLHENRISSPAWSSFGLRTIARQLETESLGIPFFDHVFCLSETEVEISRWLGAASVGWLPRVIEPDFLETSPKGDRLGCIGTMDHPPNREGMELFLQNLDRVPGWQGRVRLISRSENVCKQWASRYRFVDFLGPLNKEYARKEASTWSGFLHPIFCHAMGCSTKLSSGIRWGLPLVTSEAGARGYRMIGNLITLYNKPMEMAQYAASLLQDHRYEQERLKTRKWALAGPSLSEVVAMAKKQIGPLSQ
jgi:hypothetical protein